MSIILTTINNVLPEIGFPTLTTMAGNSNQTAAQALAIANRTGRDLARKPWRILVKRNVITTASSAESYSLPSDFEYFVPETEWNDSNDEPMNGPLSDPRWQADISGLTTVTVNDRFQVRADGNSSRFFIRPIPTSSENVTFFYISNGWLTSTTGTRKNSITADTDVLLLDAHSFELEFKWRFLRAQRREYQDERAEAMRATNIAFARDGGMNSYRILGPIDHEITTEGRIPETGFGS